MTPIKHVGRDGATILCVLVLMALAVGLAKLAATGLIYLGQMLLTAW